MFEWLNLLPLGTFVILLYGSCRVSYNSNYLSLATSKYMKGWASFLVVLHHLSQCTMNGILFRPFTQVGYLAVAIFFFFSAFGLQKRYMKDPSYANSIFLLNRLLMLCVPYLVAVIIFIILVCFCYGYYIPVWRFVVPSYENHGTAYPYAWFIYCIFGFYIWYWGCMKICKRNYKALLVGILVYCGIWISFAAEKGLAEISSMSAIPLGMIWAWKEEIITRLLKENYMRILCVTAVGIYGMIITSYSDIVPLPIARNINTILWLFTLFLFLSKWRVGNRILLFLGKFYFEIYLVQGVMIVLVFGAHKVDGSAWNEFVRCLIVLMGSGVFSCFLNKLYDKPLQKYRQKILNQYAPKT